MTKPKRRLSLGNQESTSTKRQEQNRRAEAKRQGRESHQAKPYNPGPWKSPEPRPWERLLGPDKPAPRAKGIQ